MRGKLLQSLHRIVAPHIARGEKLLVAVSGGIDSVSLLMALRHSLRMDPSLLLCAHFDHGLRKESAEDARWVEAFARTLGVSSLSARATTTPGNKNLESWAREERYRFLMKAREESGASWILVAHTGSDQIETLFLQLLAGKKLAPFSLYDHRRKVLRPLLECYRTEITEYAREQGLQWREDPTNADESRERNKVRHTLLPWLVGQYGERVLFSLKEGAERLAEDEQWCNEEVQQRLTAHPELLAVTEAGWGRLVTGYLRKESPAMQWRLIEEVLLPLLGFRLGRFHAKAVVDFLIQGKKRMQLPGGTTLERYKELAPSGRGEKVFVKLYETRKENQR